MFKKIICLVGLLSSSEMWGGTEAVLEINAEVEPEIKLTRTGGDLDFFKENEISFLVEANTSAGVDVTVRTQNNFIAKHSEHPEYQIPYKLYIKINNENWSKLLANYASVEIPQEKFSDRTCSFSLKSKVRKKKLGDILPGVYSDQITISVTAHK